MTLHRFFVPPGSLRETDIALHGEVAHQIARVLRLRVGEEIVLLEGDGRELQVRLCTVDGREVRGEVVISRAVRGEPALRLTLYQALLARERFEHVLQKGTEVGVSTFVPVRTERSLAKLSDVGDEKLRRWRTIIREAAEQSERGRIPDLVPPVSLAEALKRGSEQDVRLFAWERETNMGPTRALGALSSEGSAALFVGPEGGFSEAEVDLARASGATTFGLGVRVLRAETVGPVLAALALFASGGLDRDYR